MSDTLEYDVVPLALLDTTHLAMDIVIEFSMFFKEQLCFKKLEKSWSTLVQAWPILSARIRKDSSSPSGFVYHVPTIHGLASIRRRELGRDTKERQFYCLDEGHRSVSTFSPALGYSESPPKEIFTVAGPLPEEHAKVVTANAARSTIECLNSDRPLVSVQVSRFNDGTLISLVQSHVIGDCFSVKAIVVAWQNILNGNGLPTPILDFGMDPYKSLGPDAFPPDDSKPTLPIGVTLYSLSQKIRLLYNYLYDFYWTRPEKTLQQRYIFIPHAELDDLQAQAKLDLARKAAREGKEHGEADKVSNFNIIYAWAMQHSHVGIQLSRISTPLCIYNIKRDKPTGIETYPRHDFWGGAYAVPLDSLSTEKLRQMPLGELALLFRQSLEKHRTADASRDVIRSMLKYSGKNSKTPALMFFGTPTDYFNGITDWRLMKWYQVDFGGAVVLNGDNNKDKNSTAAAPLCNIHADMEIPMSKRDRWVLLGDSKDGVWITGGMTRDHWNHPEGFGRYRQCI